MATGKQPAVLVVHTNTYFANLLPIARVLHASDRYVPCFWFVRPYPTLADDVETCRRDGIAHRVHEHDGWARLERTAPVIAHTARLVTTRQRVRRWLRELAARLMILPADNRYDLAVYVRAAHDEQVKVAVLPAFMAATREWAEYMRGVPDYSLDKLANRVAARLYPRWLYDHEGTRMVALPASQLLPRQWLGLTPPLPWTLHSGHSDAIAMESAAMKRYCMREGLPEERMTVTGSVDHDLMSHRLTLARDRSELVLLTALPPDQLYGRGRKDCEFQNYNDLVDFWISSLAAITGWRTIVSLHPSVKRESMLHLEAKGVTIADAHVSALIPQCDVYVASVSATIQWAIACGKPVINYDVYRYRYPDYLGVDGVVLMETQEEFRAAVARVTGDAKYRAELGENQRRHAPDWGVLDGHAGDRLLALFDRLTR